jgi:serine/threonine protein kinase
VDFALASSFAEMRPEFTHHSEIVGTLAYLAPEATGRTGRLVDQRADLYALGAVLYELATGELPFGTGDPLRLIHDHLARVPVPSADRPTPLKENDTSLRFGFGDTAVRQTSLAVTVGSLSAQRARVRV